MLNKSSSGWGPSDSDITKRSRRLLPRAPPDVVEGDNRSRVTSGIKSYCEADGRNSLCSICETTILSMSPDVQLVKL